MTRQVGERLRPGRPERLEHVEHRVHARRAAARLGRRDRSVGGTGVHQRAVIAGAAPCVNPWRRDRAAARVRPRPFHRRASSSRASERKGARRRSVGDPGLSSSRPFVVLADGQVRVAEDDDTALREPAAQARRASRLRAGVVHHPDQRARELDDAALRQAGHERVAVAAHRGDGRVGAELDQDLRIREIAAVQDRVGRRGVLEQRGGQARPPCGADVRVRGHEHAH